MHVNQQPPAIQVLDLQPDQRADAQAQGLVGLQQHALDPRPGCREQLHDLFRGQHHGQGLGPFGEADEGHDVGAPEGLAIEQLPGADGLIEQAPGDAGLDQVQLEATQFLRAELIGGTSEVLRQAGDPGDLGLDGAGRVVAQAQVVAKALP